jgi:methyl-accepting chemotaxis protein
MSVRAKLLVGYGYLFILLLVTVGSAAWGFSILGRGIDRILHENFESVSASMAMMEALERQDSLTLASLLDPTGQEAGLAASERDFDAALARVRANITMEEERPIIERVESKYKRYRESRKQLMDSRPAQPLAAYWQNTFPPFDAAKREVQALIDANRRAMHDADRQARETATASAAWTGLLVVVTLVSVALLYRWLQRDILLQLDQAQDVADAIAAGDRTRRIPTRGGDGLGRLGRSLNAVLDRQASVEAQLSGLVAHSGRLLLGLLGHLPGEHGLLGLDGRVVCAHPSTQDTERLRQVADRLLAAHKGIENDGEAISRSHEFEVVLSDGTRAACHLLATGLHRERPVGWLVSFTSAESTAV